MYTKEGGGKGLIVRSWREGVAGNSFFFFSFSLPRAAGLMMMGWIGRGGSALFKGRVEISWTRLVA